MISVRIREDFLWWGFDHEFGRLVSEQNIFVLIIKKKTYFKISYLGFKVRFNFLVKVILPRDNQIIDLATADWESIVTSQVVPIYNSVPFRNLVKILIWKNKLLIKFLTFQSLIVLSFVESKKCAALRRGSQRILLIWKNKVWQWNKMVEKNLFFDFEWFQVIKFSLVRLKRTVYIVLTWTSVPSVLKTASLSFQQCKIGWNKIKFSG